MMTENYVPNIENEYQLMTILLGLHGLFQPFLLLLSN